MDSGPSVDVGGGALVGKGPTGSPPQATTPRAKAKPVIIVAKVLVAIALLSKVARRPLAVNNGRIYIPIGSRGIWSTFIRPQALGVKPMGRVRELISDYPAALVGSRRGNFTLSNHSLASRSGPFWTKTLHSHSESLGSGKSLR